MPEIPIRLQSEPEVRAHASDACEAQRGVWGDGTLAANDLVQAWKRDAEANREGGLGNAEGLEKFFQQHFAGMGRRPLGWEPPLDEFAGGLGALSDSP